MRGEAPARNVIRASWPRIRTCSSPNRAPRTLMRARSNSVPASSGRSSEALPQFVPKLRNLVRRPRTRQSPVDLQFDGVVRQIAVRQVGRNVHHDFRGHADVLVIGSPHGLHGLLQPPQIEVEPDRVGMAGLLLAQRFPAPRCSRSLRAMRYPAPNSVWCSRILSRSSASGSMVSGATR